MQWQLQLHTLKAFFSYKTENKSQLNNRKFQILIDIKSLRMSNDKKCAKNQQA